MGKDLSREIVWVKDENADIPGYVQNSTNIIVVDHKGSLYYKYKDTLEQEGYKVECLDLNHPEKGNHYNPFHYIHNIDDIEALVDAIIESERPVEALASETIESEMPAAGPWRKREKLLLNAVFSYVYLHMPPEQKKISSILPLIMDCGGDFVNTATSDNPFEKLREQCQDSYAVGKYIEFRNASRSILGEHYISVLVSCAVRLQIFDHQVYHNVAIVTNTDDLKLEELVNDKFAVFVVVPSRKETYNIYDIISDMLYCQISRFPHFAAKT